MLWQSVGVGRLGNRLVLTRSCWSRRSFLILRTLLISMTGRKKSRNLRTTFVHFVARKVLIVLLIFIICDLVRKKVVTVRKIVLPFTSNRAIGTTTKSMEQGHLIGMGIQSKISW